MKVLIFAQDIYPHIVDVCALKSRYVLSYSVRTISFCQ
jgi:hypothetical protein